MKEISTKVSSSVFAQHKSQVNKAIKKAVEDTMKTQKPINEQFVAEFSEYNSIVKFRDKKSTK